MPVGAVELDDDVPEEHVDGGFAPRGSWYAGIVQDRVKVPGKDVL
jgi:hypothetical protein